MGSVGAVEQELALALEHVVDLVHAGDGHAARDAWPGSKALTPTSSRGDAKSVDLPMPPGVNTA